MQRKHFIYFLIILLPFVGFAARRPPFRAGRDYQVIKVVETTADTSNKEVEVIEFFSYGCPWCFRLEATLEKWVADKPKNVTFKRVPVVFEKSWDIYAKTYYTAEALDVTNKINTKIFKAIHEEKQTLTDEKQVEDFFVKAGIDKETFESAWNFSPGIDMQMNRGFQLLRKYKILSVPTLVIDGHYKVNSKMAKGDFDRMMRITNYLIKKSRS